MNSTKRLIILFLLIAASGILKAQTYSFREFSVSEGLPQGYIYNIAQSGTGNLWLGTGEGLARYNGKTFDVFKEKDGLAESFVTQIISGDNNHLWIGHFSGGITFFNGNKFIPLPTKDISSSPVTTICKSSSGDIWVGTQADGIYKVNHDLKVTGLKNTFTEASVHSITETEEGELLIGTGAGLYKIKEKEGELVVVDKWLEQESIRTLNKGQDGSFWAGTLSGKVFLFNAATGNIREFNTSATGDINIIYEDQEKNLWLSSYGDGMYKLNITRDTLLPVAHYAEKTGLANNYVHSFLIDRENNIWFGTFGSGLAELENPMFQYFSSKNGLPAENVTALTVDSSGTLWVAFDDMLVYRIGKESGFHKADIQNPGKITALSPGINNGILIGTEKNGVFLLKNVRSRPIRLFYSGSDRLLNNISDITTGINGDTWISTSSGVVRVTADGSHKVYQMKDGLAHNKVYSLFRSQNNNIWFATHGGGLSYYDDGRIKTISSPFPSSGLEINCFAEDKQGNLFIGTYGQGVFIMKNKEFVKRYTANDGLISNYCYQLYTDRNDKLWVGHKSGITKVDPATDKLSRFYKKEGFEVENLTANAVAEGTEGNLWFGSANGILQYHIKADKPKGTGPIVNLTGLDLFYQDTDWKAYSDSVFGLAGLPGKLTLPHNKNHLTFKVIGTTLSPSTDNVKYQYKLDGFENDWSLVTEESFVTYANLPPGQYRFQVRAGNAYGVWNELSQPFSFTVLSPFWQTWWFILISILSVSGMVAFIIKARTDNLRNQRERLQREKLKLEAEIRERIKAQKLQKLVEEKLIQTNKELNNFIYRASHDLRGPISTMKGLTQLGLMELKDEQSTKFLNLIMERTFILDGILKNLINVVEVIEGDTTLSNIDLNTLIEDVYQQLTEEEGLSNINKEINIDTRHDFYNDENLISSIFRNLIQNSLKFRDMDKAENIIRISVTDHKNGILFKLTDNGIGIEEHIKDKVFDMFFRGTDQSSGSGLGLYTVKKIVTKLEGKISLRSEENEGTTVKLYLPNMKNKSR